MAAAAYILKQAYSGYVLSGSIFYTYFIQFRAANIFLYPQPAGTFKLTRK